MGPKSLKSTKVFVIEVIINPSDKKRYLSTSLQVPSTLIPYHTNNTNRAYLSYINF